MSTAAGFDPDNDAGKEICIESLEDLARGGAFLGTGGGGLPYIGRLIAEQAIREHGKPKLLSVEDVADDSLVCCVAGFGAPTVQVEKLICGDEVAFAFARLEEHLDRRIDAILPAEIGGSNSLVPIMLAATRGLPVIDADGMGRAFPELHMNSLCVHGIRATPLVVADEHLNFAIVQSADDCFAEHMVRALAVRMGLRVFVAGFPMSGQQLKSAAIRDTLSVAHGIGGAIRRGRQQGNAVASLIDYLETTEHYRHAKLLFDGKIVDLVRETAHGFSVGRCRMTSLDNSRLDAEVSFQNENLLIAVGGEIKAMVPDLVCIVDRDTAEPIPTPELRYGQRVKVIGASAPAQIRTPAALSVFGPAAFGLEHAFTPIERL
jgi:hypothetical protein